MLYDSNARCFAIVDLNQHAFLVLKGMTPTFSNLGILLKTDCMDNFRFALNSHKIIEKEMANAMETNLSPWLCFSLAQNHVMT